MEKKTEKKFSPDVENSAAAAAVNNGKSILCFNETQN
jgi:hypothetical protein